MIQYSLICENRHTFDAWFHNAAAYDEQERRGIVQLRCVRPGRGRRPGLQQHASGHDVRHRQVLRGHVEPQG